jgi:hypothetical protein
MDDRYASVDPNRLKHLEMIQAVVARLAGNSFLIKGWSVTIAGAFLGLAVSRGEAKLAGIGVVPIAIFWGLDAYFLYAERLFRALYDLVRQDSCDVEPFFMGATGPAFAKVLESHGVRAISFRDAVWRPTVWVFHGALVTASALVIVAIRAA